MNFILFLIYYFICTIILILILFLLYKFYLKKIIQEKFSFVLSDFFNTDNDKSILDINFEEKEEEVNDNDKTIPTIF